MSQTQKSQTQNMNQTPDLKKKLQKIFSSLSEWERKPLIEGVTIVAELIKLPERKTKRTYRPARLALQIRRTDAFRGIIIDSESELEELRKIVDNAKLAEIVKTLSELTETKTEIKEFEI